MTDIGQDALRTLVRQVINETIPWISRGADAASQPSGQPPMRQVEEVHLGSDADLVVFVKQLLDRLDRADFREGVRSGRISFRLHGNGSQNGRGAEAAHRVEKGAVTEATVMAAAKNGSALVLAKGVVVTPLAVERASELRVRIEKER